MMYLIASSDNGHLTTADKSIFSRQNKMDNTKKAKNDRRCGWSAATVACGVQFCCENADMP